MAEGGGSKLRPLAFLEKLKWAAFALHQKYYGWKLDPEMGPVFKVTPRVVFAMPEKLFPAVAARWLFD